MTDSSKRYRNSKVSFRHTGRETLVARIALAGLFALILFGVVGCRATKQVTVDLSPTHTAVRTVAPDTVYRSNWSLKPIFLPGLTITVPDTVIEHVYSPSPATDYPLKRIEIDSATVRLTGACADFVFGSPAPGERLIISASGKCAVESYVEGAPIKRVVTLTCPEPGKPSFIDRLRGVVRGAFLIIVGGIIVLVFARRFA